MGHRLLDLYDDALPQVYGYLAYRCGDASLAEDLTGEVFLAAVDAEQRGAVADLTVAWLIGVARHKLVDHWRRRSREDRLLAAVGDVVGLAGVAGGGEGPVEDPWDDHLDAGLAHAVLAGLGPHHRAALTLRYVDGLSVPEAAGLLGRTVHATEALLVRARAAFRRAYEEEVADAG